MPRLSQLVLSMTTLFATLVPTVASAAPEELEVSFDLAQYMQNGSFSFSRGCIAVPPTGRMNYVHLTVVWLEDDQGRYVTTLYRWGRSYPYDLKAWATASDFDVDGITRATPTSNGNSPAQVFHNFTTGVHDISWLPDGDYRIRLESTQCELADEYRSGTTPLTNPEATFNFTKGRAAQTDVNLGSTAPFNNVTINYVVPASNAPPGAWAGVDQKLMPSVVPSDASTTLDGRISDDSGNPPTVAWAQVGSEPAGLVAQIAAPASAQTAVTFDVAGIYTFRLTATDANGLSSSDEVVVWVNAYTLDATHDAEVARGQANTAMGIIENSGPWVWAWGQCNAGENYSRGYFRFDVSGASGAITFARLRLPFAEATPSNGGHHDFYLLTDAQDDWNTTVASTDWEATITFNNQSVPMGLATNLNPQQLMGTWLHGTCVWRHAFANPDPPPGPGSECPGWINVDLDVSNVAMFDTNREWSIFMASREGCMNGLGLGSKENLINTQLLVVEHWQSTVNQAPVANAGPDRVVTDTLPSGNELVTLDGSASTDDAGIVSYAWTENSQLLGTSGVANGVTVPLALGLHDLTLTVTDGAALSNVDAVQIVVEDRYYPNHTSAQAALIDGDATGKLYADLYAYTQAPGGDWYAIDLVDGTDLGVTVTMTGGDLDLALFNPAGASLMSSATSALTESITEPALPAGRYLIQVSAKTGGASPYQMTVQVSGATLLVALNPMSAVESSGTLSSAGTVTIGTPAPTAVSVTLAADLPQHLTFGTNPVTIPMGATSANFDVVLVDDPAGAPNANRYVNITATAPNYNRGSAVFEILDDEASLVVTWDKAAEMTSETGSPLVILTAQLSGTPGAPVMLPITIGGTAQAGTDFDIAGSPTMLTFNGTTRATLPIALRNDTSMEGPETVIVTMGTPVGASVGSIREYTLTITDDDSGGGGNDAGTAPPPGDDPVEGSGCACRDSGDTTGSPMGIAALALLALVRRRRPGGSDRHA